jgi:MOSC domain-containing protein YiiM
MKIAGVSMGKVSIVQYRGKSVQTGIFKTSSEGPVFVSFDGLLEDVQVDRKNHGGPDKAIYAYSLENLKYWAELRLDSTYPAGHMGENLTIEGLDDHQVYIGDRFRMGGVTLEVTQPRVPCFKLGIRMADARFVAQFLSSGRTGFYLRVLEEGTLKKGDPVIKIYTDSSGVSIPDAMKAILAGPDQVYWIQKVLDVQALSNAWREDLHKRLSSKSV